MAVSKIEEPDKKADDNTILPGENICDLTECGAPNIKIIQNKKFFCYGIDAVLLASFAAKSQGRRLQKCRIADLGSGNGIIPLLLAGRGAENISGLEVQEALCSLANRSVKLNNLKNKIQIVKGDIKDICLEKNHFNIVVTNPPYEKILQRNNSTKASEKEIARAEILCTLNDLVRTASLLLKNSGSLYMIHRPARLDEIISSCGQNQIQIKELQFVFPSAEKNATMVLIHGVKCGRPGIKILSPLVVYKRPGIYSEDLEKMRK